jgi:hypothetical protein
MLRSVGRAGRTLCALGFLFTAAVCHADVIYTLSNTGPTPYNFSFVEPGPLVAATGPFAIPAFTAGGTTFTQGAFFNLGAEQCFEFGSAGASLSVSQGCAESVVAPQGAIQSLFQGAVTPGSYAAIGAQSLGNAPASPDLLTITPITAVQYTFSKTGPTPYNFSFVEPSPLVTATGPFAIPAFAAGGTTFTQGAFFNLGAEQCFEFGSAGASLSVSQGCAESIVAPQGAIQSLFQGAVTPGNYAAIGAQSLGNAPASPNQLIITAVPEPTGLALLGTGLAGLAVCGLRRRLGNG